MVGCSLHQVDHNASPRLSAPQSYSSMLSAEEQAVWGQSWWLGFDRPDLDNLINEALRANQDVARSVAVLEQARAIVRRTESDRLPAFDFEGGARKDWEGSEGQRGSSSFGGAFSWEIDLFDRIGSSAEARWFEAKARAEDVDAVKLSLSADVAMAYFGAIAAQQRVKLLQEQLTLDKELQELLQLRLENGVGTNVDVLQQKARVADSETLIPTAEADLAIYENRLDVLLGQMPDGQNRVQISDDGLYFTENLPPLGVPSALLLSRPDLRAAQAELIEADADIASAIADRLPRLTLDGSYKFSDTGAYTGPVSFISGLLVQPLLDWGQRKAEVTRNRAVYEERLSAFTQLYLEAVEEVENALIREVKHREFLQRLQTRRDILQQTVDASEDRYTQGIDDYLPVINALQELRQVERDLISEQLALVNYRIALFRALGGPVLETVSSLEE